MNAWLAKVIPVNELEGLPSRDMAAIKQSMLRVLGAAGITQAFIQYGVDGQGEEQFVVAVPLREMGRLPFTRSYQPGGPGDPGVRR